MGKVSLLFRLISSLVLILVFNLFSYSQGIPQFTRQTSFTATGAGAAYDVRSFSLGDYKIQWATLNGTSSACTFNIQTSPDNVTFTSVSKTFTCTSDGQGDIFPATTSFVRINLATFTPNSAATPILTVTILGWTDADPGVAIDTFPTSVTTTARNALGDQIFEKGSRWAVISNPAASSQATASIAAEAGVRHIADCIAFSAAATTAVGAAALLTVNLRDGATGAGTVIWTYELFINNTTGQLVTPQNLCGLNLVGTTNTAMTFEFSALTTNLIESVSLSGFNIN